MGFPSLVLVIFIGTADMPLQVLTIILLDTDDLPNGYLINFLMNIDDLSSWVMNIHTGADDFPHRH